MKKTIKMPKCLKTATGEHYFLKYNIFSVDEKKMKALIREGIRQYVECVFCGLIDDRPKEEK